MTQKTQRKASRSAVSRGSLQEILDVDDKIKELRRNLGARPVEAKDEETGESTIKWKLENEALIESTEGVKAVLGFVREHIGKNHNLSEYEKREIKRRMRVIHEKLADLITENYIEWGIGTIGRGEMIISMVTDTIESSYRRALKGKERKMISEITQDRSDRKIVEKGYVECDRIMSKKYCKTCGKEFSTKDRHGRIKLQVRDREAGMEHQEVKNLWYCCIACLKVDICE